MFKCETTAPKDQRIGKYCESPFIRLFIYYCRFIVEKAFSSFSLTNKSTGEKWEDFQ